MKNKWMKKLCKNVIGFTVFLTVTVTHSSLTHGTDIIRFNMLNEDSVSENETEGLSEDCTYPLGMSARREAGLREAHKADSVTFKTLNSGTWQFNQSFARGELFRAFDAARSNPNNWWLCTNDEGQPVTTKSVALTNPHYTYDYELEKMAMQRCVEIAFNYGHSRPCGATWEEVTVDVPTKVCEGDHDIGFGEMNGKYGNTAQGIVDMYMEGYEAPAAYRAFDGRKYMADNYFCHMGGQGHRQIILNDKFERIGIACITTMEGWYYTEIIVSYDKEKMDDFFHYNNAPTPCVDGYKEISVDMSNGARPMMYSISPNQTGYIGDGQDSIDESYHIKVGESISLSDIYIGGNGVVVAKADDTRFKGWQAEPDVNSSSTSFPVGVVSFDGNTNTITGVKAGINATYVSSKSGDICAAIWITVDADPNQVEEETPEQPTPTPTINTPNPSNEDTSIEYDNSLGKLKLNVYKKNYKAKTLKKSSKSFNISPTCENAKSVTYQVTKGKKTVKVNKYGKVTVKKGAKKGTYQVKVTAKGYNGEKRTKLVAIHVK